MEVGWGPERSDKSFKAGRDACNWIPGFVSAVAAAEAEHSMFRGL